MGLDETYTYYGNSIQCKIGKQRPKLFMLNKKRKKKKERNASLFTLSGHKNEILF